MLAALPADVKVRFVDFHAEVTSEKMAMGWYLDGRVSAVVGTHTHIPTADTRILPGGTAYQTDCGMTGPYDSVIGVGKGNHPAEIPHGACRCAWKRRQRALELHSVIVEVDESHRQGARHPPPRHQGGLSEWVRPARLPILRRSTVQEIGSAAVRPGLSVSLAAVAA